MLDLKGKIAAVMGSASIIGKAIATTFIQADAFANGADFRTDGGLTLTPRTRPDAGSNQKK